MFASTSFLFFCLFQNYFAYATCFKPVSCSLIYIFGRVIYTACAYAHLDVNDNLEQYITALLTGVIAPLHAEWFWVSPSPEVTSLKWSVLPLVSKCVKVNVKFCSYVPLNILDKSISRTWPDLLNGLCFTSERLLITTAVQWMWPLQSTAPDQYSKLTAV